MTSHDVSKGLGGCSVTPFHSSFGAGECEGPRATCSPWQHRCRLGFYLWVFPEHPGNPHIPQASWPPGQQGCSFLHSVSGVARHGCLCPQLKGKLPPWSHHPGSADGGLQSGIHSLAPKRVALNPHPSQTHQGERASADLLHKGAPQCHT